MNTEIKPINPKKETKTETEEISKKVAETSELSDSKTETSMTETEERMDPDMERKSNFVPKKQGFSLGIGGVSPLTIALSIRHLSLMLKSGLALNDAVAVLAKQTADKKLKKIYNEIVESISSGNSLGDSMKNHKNAFSDIVISIIDVGEQGGTLEKNLSFLSDYLKKDYELKKKVKGALMYPMIVFSLTIIEMLGVIFFILPKLSTLFSSFKDIPPFTKFVVDGSAAIKANSGIIGVSILILIILYLSFLRTKPGKVFKDRMSLTIPVIKKLTRSNILATFTKTVSILLESGIPIVKALEISSQTIGNSVYQNILKKVYEEVKSGKNVAEALEKYPKYFPTTFVKMIEVGETTGTLEENLKYLYDFHAEEVEDISTNLTTLIEPILLVFIGVMIGGLAIIIIGPIYQFTGSINS